eukprot:223236_1
MPRPHAKDHCGTQLQYQNYKYTVVKRLGSGGFADVYLVQSLASNRFYACKYIQKATIKSSKHREKIDSEIRLHSLCGIDNILENKYVVPFRMRFDDAENIHILMSYCPNGSLEGWLKKRKMITEPETRFVLKQITNAVKHLHEDYQIIHRDLKLGNILFDQDMNIKLCDFGLATQLVNNVNKKFTVCGTPNYIAPEIASGINNSKGNVGHSYGVDIWAIGVMTYTLLYGEAPFATKNIANTCEKIKKSQFVFPINARNDSQLSRCLIRQLLTVDATQRLNLQGILNHGFLKAPIPKQLPESCLVRAPSEQDLFQFNNKENENKIAMQFNDTVVNIVNFVDYSAKYGIGYILSNGWTGVSFNDTSGLILPIDKKVIYYVDPNERCTLYDYKEFVHSDIQDSTLKKRLEIFMQIAKVVWKDFTLNKDIFNIPIIANENDIKYVQRWKRSKHAIVFRLNRGVVQALFRDDTVVTLKCVNVNKDAQKSSSTLVVFMQKSRGVLHIFPSYTQFKNEATKDMQFYIEHIKCHAPMI